MWRWGAHVGAIAGVVPTFSPMPVDEAAYLMQGLYLQNLLQLQKGYRGINAALMAGVIRYDRYDPNEHWQTIRDLWQSRAGDCEDLAAAIAAELTFSGVPARPVIFRVRPGLMHAVTQITAGPYAGRIIDPSLTGGMGRA